MKYCGEVDNAAKDFLMMRFHHLQTFKGMVQVLINIILFQSLMAWIGSSVGLETLEDE